MVSVEHDGLTIGALDWGGDGPPLVLLHPNGFCAGVFDPLARALRVRAPGGGDRRAGPRHQRRPHPVRGLRVRGRRRKTWWRCSTTSALEEVVILGESLGGGTGILVDRLRPGLVRKLLLCEAIAMPAIDGLPGAERREPHVGHGPEAARGVARPRHGARVVRQPSADERDRAGRARGLRAVGVPRPARRSGGALVPAGGGGVVLRVRDATRRRAGVVRPPRVVARRDDDRVRRRHRPARRHVRGAGRARRRRPHHRRTAPTSSCRRTPRGPPRSSANTWPDVLAPRPRLCT